MSTTTKWIAGTNAGLGVWLIIAPFLFEVPDVSFWNAVIVGGTIATIGVYNWTIAGDNEAVSVGAASVNALLGLWLIAAPFLFNPGATMFWNNIIVGAIVASLAGYNAYAGGQTEEVDVATA